MEKQWPYILINMRFHFVFCFLFLSIITDQAFAGQNEQLMKLEQSVCGLKEPFIFWMWSNQAGRPDKRRLVGLSNVEDISFTTKDNKILRGYQLKAHAKDRQRQTVMPKGYVLVMQGNAILADQILGDFSRYAAAGYDVYVYDYRGYGRSEGKRRLKAIVSDYKEIIAFLNSAAYKQQLVYAMSFGGIVFLDALESGFKLDRIIIDSSPSRLSNFGCEAEYDPIIHLPADCTKYMFIVGLSDNVIPPGMSQEMVELAQQRNATVVRDMEFSHPFMDLNWSAHQRRMNTIEQFLLQR